MYRNIRIIHLILGLLTAPLLLMYSVSAIQMGHRSWFALNPAVRTERLTSDMDCQNPRELAASLMRAQGWRGELTEIKATPAGCTLQIASLGTTHEIRYQTASRELLVRTSRLGAMGVLNRMHHAAGMWHESAGMKTWAAVVALASVALLGMIATGVWLWLLRKRERRLGLILVAANLGFSLTILILLRIA